LGPFRLSPANTESRPHQIKDGDILQVRFLFLPHSLSLYLFFYEH
jgi:hypothetical protein